jgi:hypothetical protein
MGSFPERRLKGWPPSLQVVEKLYGSTKNTNLRRQASDRPGTGRLLKQGSVAAKWLRIKGFFVAVPQIERN